MAEYDRKTRTVGVHAAVPPPPPPRAALVVRKSVPAPPDPDRTPPPGDPLQFATLLVVDRMRFGVNAATRDAAMRDVGDILERVFGRYLTRRRAR